MAQLLLEGEKIQDGDVVHHHSGPGTRRTYGFAGPFGSLGIAHSDSGEALLFPVLCLWEGALPVQSPSVWPYSSPTYLPKAANPPGSLSETTKHPGFSILGQHPGERKRPRCTRPGNMSTGL